MVFAIKGADCHKYFGAGFARCPRSLVAVCFDSKVEINEKCVVLGLIQYNISDGYITVEYLGI